MKLYIRGHEDRYALEQLQLCLFPDEPMEFCPEPFDGDGAVSVLRRGSRFLTATTVITRGGVRSRISRRLKLEDETYALRRRLLQRSYYLAALPLLAKPPVWGALSGVRPTKLTTRHLLAGGNADSAGAMMEQTFFVSPGRAELCVQASLATVRALQAAEAGDVSVYVGIPFCPSRCSYCSFVSQTIGGAGALLEPYLDCLLREIALVGPALARLGRRVRTLYVGGGTPTTLSTPQLERLMQAIARHFDLSGLIEYTVEGGRPDTLDPEKLLTIRRLGATRMSINPQSMDDRVLAAVGRPHTGADVERAFRQAEQAGFTSVNMDLIAGLPGDSLEGFTRSLERVLALNPSNITVHTLALKKGADLFTRRQQLPSEQTVTDMVDTANRLLRSRGYRPYYLYRQKYMSGSFENVGWCRDGDLCLYNIYMMEELHTIVSLGGGGMSKLNLSATRLERFHNPKFPQQYIDQFDQVLAQKQDFLARLGQIDPLRDLTPEKENEL